MAGYEITFLMPIKGLSKGKSRIISSIADVPNPTLQREITTALMEDMFDVLMELVPRVKDGLDVHFIVCSDDDAVEPIVKERGEPFVFIHEREFWHVLENVDDIEKLDAIIHCMNLKAVELFDPDGTILLMNDLPLLQVDDLVSLLKTAKTRRGHQKVFISPAPGNGCNLIARFPPDVIRTRFGDIIKPSFIANIQLAREKARELNLPSSKFVKIIKNLSFYLDFDTPQDILHILPVLEETKENSRLLKILKQLHLKIEKECDENNRKINFSLLD